MSKTAPAARTIVPAPVRRSVRVKADPARAFEVFTGGMGKWWSPANKIGTSAFKTAIVEPKVGGRWYEIGEDGSQFDWGKVLAWDPPRRLLLAWQVTANWSYDPNFTTEVEITFTPDGTGTLVELEHRNLERFGDAAESIRTNFQSEGGWPGMLERFRALADV